MKIAIMGTGAYSLGLCTMLIKNPQNKIIFWTEKEANVLEFNQTHQLKNIFEDVVFSRNVMMTTSYEEALKDCDLIFLVTAAKYINEVTKKMAEFYRKGIICIASKGIEDKTLSVLSTVVQNNLHTKHICAISGPTFAIDLIHNEPTALAIAGYYRKDIEMVKRTLENQTLKLRISQDLIGIQLCGSLKNIIAIAAGILKGLGYTESTQAFLINESLHDIKDILAALGGKKKTILSFAGIGDLLLTCSSTKSRNYSFGYVIGKTKQKEKIQEYLNNNTVEGYYTLNSVYKMLNKKGINIPLISLIYDIVMNNKDPESLAKFLITKD